MREIIAARLEELARRAGVRGAPPAAVAGVLALCVVAVAWAAWRWWPDDGGSTQQVEFTQAAPATRSAEQTAAPAVAMLVHVVGAVRRPGVYELQAGSRVIDAVEAAGGALPDALVGQVNLAKPTTDGEQVHIPSEDDPVAETAAGGATAPPGGTEAASGGAVDINTADAAALDSLPGVGPSTAAKIIAEREKNGPFTSVEDLSRVSGIGPKRLEQLTGLAVVR